MPKALSAMNIMGQIYLSPASRILWPVIFGYALQGSRLDHPTLMNKNRKMAPMPIIMNGDVESSSASGSLIFFILRMFNWVERRIFLKSMIFCDLLFS